MTVSVPAGSPAHEATDVRDTAAPPRETLPRLAGYGLLLVSAGALALWTLGLQALAVVPVDWLQPVLDSFRAQKAVILLSGRRDALGAWNVVIAAVALAFALGAVRLTPRTGRLGRVTVPAVRTVTGAAATGTVTSVATYGWLVVAVAQAGAGVHLFAPGIPFTAEYGKPDTTVTSGEPGGQPLRADLYLPDDPEGSVPVVVHVHGGGFIEGRRGPTPYLRHLADNGYAVLDVDYRLASLQNHNWDTQVRDVGCALTWLTSADAAGYDLDTSRVALLGTSAGGGLALNAAYLAGNGTLAPTCRGAADLPRISAVVGLYPAVDLAAALDQSAIGRAIGERYLGGTPAEYPRRYAFTDPATHLSPEAPPTLIVQGGRDHLIRAAPVRDFAGVLAERGVPHRYVELPTLEHGAGDLVAGSVTLGTIAQRRLTLDWLDRYVR